MEHHAGQGFARPLLAMHPPPRGPGHLSGRLQGLLRPGIRALSAMFLLPALVEVFHGPAGVAGLIQRDHLKHLIHRDRAGGGLADAPIL